MARLTSRQAKELANYFHGMSLALGEYRYQNMESLSKSEDRKLDNLQWSILNYSADFLAFSTTLVMDEVASSLEKIRAITNEIKDTIEDIGQVQKAINLAEAIVSLGGAIVSKKPQAIIETIFEVIEVWES